MALARVVTFDGVTAERVEELRRRLEAGEPPEGLPRSEMILLHDAGAGQAIALVLFDSDDDYAKGDEILGGMPSEETPGTRSSVTKYDVVARVTS